MGGHASPFAETADLEAARFGSLCFKGAVAAKYLSKYGESDALLATSAWTESKSDVVASALLDWAKDNGASVFTHWWQPSARRPRHRRGCASAPLTPNLPPSCAVGASGFRSGLSGVLYNTMIDFDAAGVCSWKARVVES